MVTPVISFLGQSTAQAGRLKSMSATLADLQRQMTTQKKTETFAGLGSEANNVQRYRISNNLLKTYSANVDVVSTRMKLMTTSLQQASTTARDVLSAVKTKIGEEDIYTIKTIAEQAMPLLRDLANVDIDGRYLFAGSNTTTQPIASNAQMNTMSQNYWSDLKAGNITPSQMLASLNGLTPTQMGFDPTLTSSGSVSVRVDTSTEIDYTSIASKNGLQDIYMATSMLSQLTELDPSVDVATDADMEAALNGIIDILQRGIDGISKSSGDMGSKYALAASLQDSHKQDMANLESLIGNRENADTTEVAVQIQALQTQLSASYQVTGMLSQLSLVNYI